MPTPAAFFREAVVEMSFAEMFCVSILSFFGMPFSDNNPLSISEPPIDVF